MAGTDTYICARVFTMMPTNNTHNTSYLLTSQLLSAKSYLQLSEECGSVYEDPYHAADIQSCLLPPSLRHPYCYLCSRASDIRRRKGRLCQSTALPSISPTEGAQHSSRARAAAGATAGWGPSDSSRALPCGSGGGTCGRTARSGCPAPSRCSSSSSAPPPPLPFEGSTLSSRAAPPRGPVCLCEAPTT